MSKRKNNRKTKKRKKRICCVGIGCPEWRHCIHILGDGAKYRPKRKSTLKRMKKCGKRYTSLGKKYKQCLKKERKKTRKRRIKKYRKRHTRRRRGGAIEMISIPVDIESLRGILENAGISTAKWGSTTKTKPLSKLYDEIKKGETKLARLNGKIKRIVDSVVVKIYDNEQKAYLLYEISQHDESKEDDPSPKYRGNNDMREKMNEGEDPREAVKRGIAEELGKKYSMNMRFFKGAPTIDIDKVDPEEANSNSYPGLPAQYRWYKDEIYIPNLTNDTLYPSQRKAQKKQFFTRELKDDGSFKRYIKWEWKKT